MAKVRALPLTDGTPETRAVMQRLEDWVRASLGDVALSLEAPGVIAADKRTIGLYLLELGMSRARRDGTVPVRQFQLRYLVTAHGPDPAVRQDDLCELAFSALDMPGFEVDLEPLAAPFWAAFGVAPQAGFSLRLPLRRERRIPAATRVRVPPRLVAASVQVLHGVVLGPDDIPLAGARVELPALGRSCLSDHEGRFQIAGVPGESELRVRVRARGEVQEFDARASSDPDDAVSLRITLRSLP